MLNRVYPTNSIIRITYKSDKSIRLPLIIAIFFSTDTLMFGTNINNSFLQLGYVIIGLCALNEICIFAFKRKNIFSMSWGIVYIVVFIVSNVLNSGAFIEVAIKLEMLVFALFFSANNDISLFLESIYKFMKVISIFSLCAALIYIAIPGLIRIFPIVQNTAHNQYYYLGLSVLPVYSDKLRNYGIFREPGVYQLYLLISLWYLINQREEKRYSDIFVFIIAVISTFSTTGVIGLSVIIIFAIIDNNVTAKSKKALLLIITILFLFFVMFTNIGNYIDLIFGKLQEGNAANFSYKSRYVSILANFDIWKEYPLLGAGSSFVNNNYTSYAIKYTTIFGATNNCNTFLFVLAAYGAIIGVLFLGGIIKLSFGLKRSWFSSLSFLLLLIAIFIGQNLQYSPLPFILVFYGLRSKIQADTKN